MTEEAKEIARELLIDEMGGYDFIGCESRVTEAIEPPKKYHKETKEAWAELMALMVERYALKQLDMPRFRMMFDSLDYYFTASETIENVTAGKAGQGRPSDIYGGLKETIAARDTFAKEYQAMLEEFKGKQGIGSISEWDLMRKAETDQTWRNFQEKYGGEEWEAYKTMRADQEGCDYETLWGEDYAEDEDE